MKKKNKKFVKLKKVLAGFMALVLVIGLTIVGTLAWLSTQSNSVTNVFTATDNIYLTLVEPDYDSGEASNYKPDGTISKNPYLVNTTGDDSSEWVMIRVDYLTKEGQEISFKNAARADLEGKLFTLENYLGAGWKKIDTTVYNDLNMSQVVDASGNKAANAKCEFYVYNKALTGSTNVGSAYRTQQALETGIKDSLSVPDTAKTTPLFTSVKISSQETLTTNGYSMDVLPKFNIVIQGAAVKNEGDDAGMSTDLNFTSTTDKTKAIVQKLVDLLATKAPDASTGQHK
ncbi:MAG: hypothetical protein HFJ09_09955 [Lachnospiraceae bacterium]|nr:hypothetical protein [Lachnospiraceae bacterium]